MASSPLPEVEDTRSYEAVWKDQTPCQVNEDGWCISLETGEFLGHVDEITPLADIAVIIKRRGMATARAAGLAAQMAMLVRGITERFQPKIDRENRLVKFFDEEVLPPHIPTIRHAVQHKAKGKSMDYDMGRVQFTKSGGGLEVLDQDAATVYLAQACPEAMAVSVDLAVLPAGSAARHAFDQFLDALESHRDLEGAWPEGVSFNIRKTKIDADAVEVPTVSVVELKQLEAGDIDLATVWMAKQDEAKAAASEAGHPFEAETKPGEEYERGIVAVAPDDWEKWSVKH